MLLYSLSLLMLDLLCRLILQAEQRFLLRVVV